MTIDEAIHWILAVFIVLKVLEIADKEAGHIPVYQLTRPALVARLLYSAYRSIEVKREAV